MRLQTGNIDLETVDGFGREWEAFDQTGLTSEELRETFDAYFSLFPFAEMGEAEGFDLGCGSGRWAALVAPRVGKLYCIEPAERALAVASRRLADEPNVAFHLADVDSIPLEDSSQDFGYSLGVLHHIPDTQAAMVNCVRKLKKGAPFLVYLYYAFDNRPAWFRALWRIQDPLRRGISRAPFPMRKAITEVIAATVYLPLARAARLAEWLGRDVDAFPLSRYRLHSFYAMRTDALDRFGTRLEQRFTRAEITEMMKASGLADIEFRMGAPYWVAQGRKA
jgi:ubiquinone/menaquinone biosynthesis C-methylase UbiE